MNRRRSYRARMRLLRVIFAFSLIALVAAVGALFVVQRLDRNTGTPAPVARENYSSVHETPAASDAAVSTTQTLTESAAAPETVVAPDVLDDADAVQSVQEVSSSLLPEELRQSRDRVGLTDAVVAQIRADNASRYYYSYLSDAEQTLYAELYYIMTTLSQDVYVSATDARMLDKVQNCVMNDHPEIFYISGYYSTRYTLGDTTVGFSFTGRYLYDANEIAARNASIERYIANCLAGAPQTADDYAKIKYIYDYVIRYTRYDLNAPDNQNICSVMIGSSSVCQGYAKAAQLLLNRLGIPATLVVGSVQTETTSGPHAWNLALSNGNWYYLDVTWGDAFFQDGEQLSAVANYDYLLTTTADIAHTHTIGSVAPMPVCDHMDDNYYVREGAYFTEASLDAFGALVDRKRAEGSATVTFKCASDAVYRQMMTTLVDQSEIFRYIQKAPGESLSFTRSDAQRSFTVWF